MKNAMWIKGLMCLGFALGATYTLSGQSEALVPVLVVPASAPLADIRAGQALVQPTLSDPSASGQVDALRGRLILAVDEQVRPIHSEIEQKILTVGGRDIKSYPYVNVVRADVPRDSIETLRNDRTIAEVAVVTTRVSMGLSELRVLSIPGRLTAVLTSESQASRLGIDPASNEFLRYGRRDPCYSEAAPQGSQRTSESTKPANSQGMLLRRIAYSCSSSAGERYRDDDLLAALDDVIANHSGVAAVYIPASTTAGEDDTLTRVVDNVADVYGLTIVVAAGSEAEAAGLPAKGRNTLTYGSRLSNRDGTAVFHSNALSNRAAHLVQSTADGNRFSIEGSLAGHQVLLFEALSPGPVEIGVARNRHQSTSSPAPFVRPVDVELFDESTQVAIGQDAAGIDSSMRLLSRSSTAAILKLRSGGFEAPAVAEPFAISSPSRLRQRSEALVEVSCDEKAPLIAGKFNTVSCTLLAPQSVPERVGARSVRATLVSAATEPSKFDQQAIQPGDRVAFEHKVFVPAGTDPKTIAFEHVVSWQFYGEHRSTTRMMKFGTAPRAETPVTCQAAGFPLLVRFGGAAEIVGPLTIQCTGGAPIFQTPVQAYDITVTTNAPIANRLHQGIYTDAFAKLIFDTSGPDHPCAPATGSVCTNWHGAGFGDGVPGTPSSSGANKTLFIGELTSANTILFRQVPLHPPGAGFFGINITNLRVDTVRLVPNQFGHAPITATINSPMLSGGATVSAGLAVIASTISLRKSKTPGFQFEVAFRELLSNAFLKRNVATSVADPFALAAQTPTGFDPTPVSETGYFNPAWPATLAWNTVGLADQGTRVGIGFFDSAASVLQIATTTQQTAGPAVRRVSTDLYGAGPYSPIGVTDPVPSPGVAPVEEAFGTTRAVYEFLEGSPLPTTTVVGLRVRGPGLRYFQGQWLPSSTGPVKTIPAFGNGTGNGRVTVSSKVAAFKDGTWVIDMNGNGIWDPSIIDDNVTVYSLGAGETPVTGDWEGVGVGRRGSYRDGQWLLDSFGTGSTDPIFSKTAFFGGAGYTPVVGDWNGDGRSKIGAYKDGVWLLDYNGSGAWDGPGTDRLIFFGGPSYTPLVGDWNASGTTKIGVHHSGTWLIDFNGNFSWDGDGVDRLVYFGGPGYVPVLGDWNGSGATKIGAYLNGTWLVDYDGSYSWDAAKDRLTFFGGTGFRPVVGDWNGSGAAKIGAEKDGQWVLDYTGNYAWDGIQSDRLLYFGGPGHHVLPAVW